MKPDKKRPLTKKERVILKNETRRLRLMQEKESAEIGIALTSSLNQLKNDGSAIKRRDSFNGILGEVQEVQEDASLANYLLEEMRPPSLDEKREKSQEWRSQHREPKHFPVNPKKPRLKSETKQVKSAFVNRILEASPDRMSKSKCANLG